MHEPRASAAGHERHDPVSRCEHRRLGPDPEPPGKERFELLLRPYGLRARSGRGAPIRVPVP